MNALDASAFIALLDPRDDHHERARSLFAGMGIDQAVMSAITLAEALVRPVQVGKGEEARKSIVDLGITVLPAPGPATALRLAELRAGTGLKLPDCCVLLAAEVAGAASVVTFDERLRRAAAQAGFQTP